MDPIWKVAVISDTHNSVPDQLPSLLASANEIWHLGDVCLPETLDTLHQLNIDLTIVQGNCDPYFNWQDSASLERHGRKFRLQHIPPNDPIPGYDAILFGHLHCPSRHDYGGIQMMNPGAITGPRNGSVASFAWLEFFENDSWTWNFETL